MPDATPARLRGRQPWTAVLGTILTTAAIASAAHAARIASTPRAEALSRTAWMEADRNAVGPIGLLPARMSRARQAASALSAWYQLEPGASLVRPAVEVGVVMVMTRRASDRAGGPPRDAWAATLTPAGAPLVSSEHPRLSGSDTLCSNFTVAPGVPFRLDASLQRVRVAPGGPPVGLAPTVRTYFCGLPEGYRVVPAKAPFVRSMGCGVKALYR